MEPMDGFELLSLLQKYPAARSIPVIVLTGRDSPFYMDRAHLDVEDYLIKPIQPRDLLQKVEAVLTTNGAQKMRSDETKRPIYRVKPF